MVNEYGSVGSYDASTGTISYSGPTAGYTGPDASAFISSPTINPALNGHAGDVNAKGQELSAYDQVYNDLVAKINPSITGASYDYPAHSVAQQQALQNEQALQAITQLQATYHHDAVATGKPTQHSDFENQADLATLTLATIYGVTGKSLANLQANYVASSVLNSADPNVNPVLMNQAEYLRQISNNPTAYGAGQPFVANAYFGQGIANTVDQAVAGVARSLGISTQAAAVFSGANYVPPSTNALMASSKGVVDSLSQGTADLIAKITGGGSSGGGTTTTDNAATDTNWISLLTAVALPVLILGIVGYLVWTALPGHHSRSAA